MLQVLAAALMLAALPAAAQQFALERDSPLYAEPRLDSTQVAQLKQGAGGEVVGKQGAWINVKTTAGNGWLFSFNVRFQAKGDTADTGGSAESRGMGARQRVRITSTIGVRGLEEEDLKQASFNAAQMQLLDGYVASKDAAEQRARGAGLASEKVEYLGSKP
jgi:hypothetical protein